MQTNYKVELPLYDGSVSGHAFLVAVQTSMDAGGVPDGRMAALVRSALRSGEARTWYQSLELNPETEPLLKSWDTLKPLFEERFCEARTMLQMAEAEDLLKQKPAESVTGFFERVLVHVLDEMKFVPVKHWAETGFKMLADLRKKSLAYRGLRDNLRLALVDLDANKCSFLDLRAAAKRAETTLCKGKSTLPSSQNSGATSLTQIKTEVAAVETTPPTLESVQSELRAFTAAMDRRFGRLEKGAGGGHGGGPGVGSRGNSRGGGHGGRGGARGGGLRGSVGAPARPDIPAARRENAASAEELSRRELQICGRCGIWCKHRTNECYADLSRGVGAIHGASSNEDYEHQQQGFYPEPLN